MSRFPLCLLPVFDLPELSARQRGNSLRALLLILGMILLFGTVSLWTSQRVFPQVPLLEIGVQAPRWLDGLCFLLLIVGLAGILVNRLWLRQLATVLFVLAGVVLIILDQHRAQPWLYQFLLLALILSLPSPRQGMKLIRLFTVSIYLHSAVSKMDISFLRTHGQDLMGVLLGFVGLKLKAWPEAARMIVAALMPLGELVVGVALIFPRTRRFGMITAMLLHLLLIAILSPWGLGHRPGVLMWNVFFIALIWVVFRRDPVVHQAESSPEETFPRRTRWANLGLCGLVWLVVLLPLLEPWGLWDRWPSWAVYAPRPERMDVYVNEQALQHFSRELQSHCHPVLVPELEGEWLLVRLDRWSLETLKVPINPDVRFQMGVARALAERSMLKTWIAVKRESAADRISGERSATWIHGREALIENAEKFWLNTRPRE